MSTSQQEISFTIGLLGTNPDFLKILGGVFGAPGDLSDIQFFDRFDNALGYVFSAIATMAYPDKLKSLLQTCALTDIHIMVIDAEVGIDAAIGEIMVAMDIHARFFNTKFLAIIGNITNSNAWRIDEIMKTLPKITAATALKGISIYPMREKADFDNLKKMVMEIGLNNPPLDTAKAPYVKVLVDHSFPVKGIGTVVLGIVKQGQVKAGEMYDLIPVQKRVILKSIQKNDRDFKTAEPRDRVGLALKGPKPEDIDRNAVFCSLNAMTTTSQLKVRVKLSPYYKPSGGKLVPGEARLYHIIADLGISPVKLISGDSIAPGNEGIIELKLEKELPHDANGLRGIVCEFIPFEKKLRILGYFESVGLI